MKKTLFLTLALAALAVVLAGCISINYSNEQVNASVNASAAKQQLDGLTKLVGDIASGQAVNVTIIPKNVFFCAYGVRDSAYEEALGGNITLLNYSVEASVKWLGPSDLESDFADCATIIVKDDEVGKYLDYTARNAIAKKAIGGAGVIFIREAATRVQSDGSIYGWDYILSDVVPARADVPSYEMQPLGYKQAEGTLTKLMEDASTMSLIDEKMFLNITIVTPKADTAAVFIVGEGGLRQSYPAVLRKQVGRNTAYYFAYDPMRTPQVLRDAVESQASKYFLAG
ncbi:hypothetical protein HY993_02950 [Candidatus Micrarchaeota archaeon]|nr:hypothetical protein [Candidatus Micrarchaeota archaeon]